MHSQTLSPKAGLALLTFALLFSGGCRRCPDAVKPSGEAKQEAAPVAESWGIRVVGKIRVAPTLQTFRADQIRVRIYPPAPPMPLSGDFREDPFWKQYEANLNTSEGKRRRQAVTVAADGSFVIPNVPTGEYWIQSYVPANLREDGVNDSIVLGGSKFSVGLYGDELSLGEF